MTAQGITAQIVEEVNDLPLEQRQQVLAFARSLAAQPKGVTGSSLLRFADTISPAQLLEMQTAIEEGCERIDTNEW